MTPGYIQLKVIVNKTLLVREMGKHLPSEQRAEQLLNKSEQLNFSSGGKANAYRKNLQKPRLR